MSTTTIKAGDTATTPTVGGYRVAERLGEGGMGEVYRAVDTMLEREVALKVLRPEMSARADVVERFRVEAIALARLHHRHIAAVYSFFQQAGQHYIAMQYVRGRTLEAVLQQRGALPWRDAAAVAIDVLHALEHAHGLGVVHRDLKPANLMLDDESRTVVMDFGIARMVARGRQTRAGTLVGTLEYIAPEIVRGELADARSDLYALGCVLYEMVTGKLPFDSSSDFALMRAHAEQVPPRPVVRSGDLPEALERIILRALEKRPEQRYASAREFRDALAAALGEAPAPVPARTIALPTVDDIAGRVRHAAAVARDRAEATLSWLALPQQGGWPAWQQWARLNLGLVGAAGVAAGALALALSMGAHELCCRAPAPGPLGLGLAQPVVPAAAVEAAGGLPSTPPVSAPPAPALTPIPVTDPARVVPVGANEAPPVLRSVRPVGFDEARPVPPQPPAASSSTPPVKPRTGLAERPSPSATPALPGWYVKR